MKISINAGPLRQVRQSETDTGFRVTVPGDLAGASFAARKYDSPLSWASVEEEDRVVVFDVSRLPSDEVPERDKGGGCP